MLLSLKELLEVAFPLAHLSLFDGFHLLAELHIFRDDIEFGLPLELHAEFCDLLMGGLHLLLGLVHKSLDYPTSGRGDLDVFLLLLAKQLFLDALDAFDVLFESELIFLLHEHVTHFCVALKGHLFEIELGHPFQIDDVHLLRTVEPIRVGGLRVSEVLSVLPHPVSGRGPWVWREEVVR